MPENTHPSNDPFNYIDSLFGHHSPDDDKLSNMEWLRSTAEEFAYAIESRVPDCADRTYAMRLLRECLMFCSTAIVLEGDSPDA